MGRFDALIYKINIVCKANIQQFGELKLQVKL